MKLTHLINRFLVQFEMEGSGCENARRVGNRYGYNIVCPEDEPVVEAVSHDANCENAKKVAAKYGYNIVCLD